MKMKQLQYATSLKIFRETFGLSADSLNKRRWFGTCNAMKCTGSRKSCHQTRVESALASGGCESPDCVSNSAVEQEIDVFPHANFKRPAVVEADIR